MKVSIVIPWFNSSKYFSQLSLSLKNYLNKLDYEIIIVDDCSEISEQILLKNFIDNLAAKNLVLITNVNNLGASVSRKIAVNSAKGDFIAFLDSDDGWNKNKLPAQVELMESLNIDILGGRTNVISHSEFIEIYDFDLKPKDILVKKVGFNKFLFNNYYSTPSVMVRRNVIVDENFSDLLRYSEDYDCWRRISLKYSSYYMVDSYTYSFKHSYLSGSSSLSTNLFQMSLGELKGFFYLIGNENLNFYHYILLPLAIVFSILKSVRRFFYSCIR